MANNNKKNRFRSYLSKINKIKIGIAWRGLALNKVNRSFDIVDLVKRISNQNIEFINLQMGDIINENKNLFSKTGKKLVLFNKFDYQNNLDGLAEIIKNCDFVITLGNSVTHLSSSLGVKTYALVAPNAQWYWISESKKNLWYPVSS